ncbi:MAG: phosphatase PAP2 family protein [Gammaproteobacteria bacterium]|nr:phosphatase PAP2 family protein [Gammaproteobacteria bacterium]
MLNLLSNLSKPERVYLGISMVLIACGLALHQTLISELLTADFNRVSRVFGDLFWGSISEFGDAHLVLPLVVLLCLRKPSDGWTIAIAVIGAAVAAGGLKDFFDAPRPSMENVYQLHVIGPEVKTRSFPSGHTLTAFTGLGLIALLRQQYLWLVMAALVALSRMAMGAHWLADVLFGAGLGLLVALAAAWAHGRIRSGGRKLNWTVLPVLALFAAINVHYDSTLPSDPFVDAFALWVLTVFGYRLFQQRQNKA